VQLYAFVENFTTFYFNHQKNTSLISGVLLVELADTANLKYSRNYENLRCLPKTIFTK